MICPFCSKEIKDGSRFCTECGAELTSENNAVAETSSETTVEEVITETVTEATAEQVKAEKQETVTPAAEKIPEATAEVKSEPVQNTPVWTAPVQNTPAQNATPHPQEQVNKDKPAVKKTYTWYWILIFFILGGAACTIAYLIGGVTPAVIAGLATFMILNCFWGIKRNWKKSLFVVIFNLIAGVLAVIITHPILTLIVSPVTDFLKTSLPFILPKDRVVSLLTVLTEAAAAVAFYELIYILLYLIGKLPVGLIGHFGCKKGNNNYDKAVQRFTSRTVSIILSAVNTVVFFFFILFPLSGMIVNVYEDAKVVASSESSNSDLNKALDEVRYQLDKNHDVSDGILFPNMAAIGGQMLYEHLTEIRYDSYATTLHKEVLNLSRGFKEIAPLITDNGFAINESSAEAIRSGYDTLMRSEYCKSLTYEFLRSAASAWNRGERYFGLSKPESREWGPVIDLLVDYLKDADNEKIDSLCDLVLDGLDIMAHSDIMQLFKGDVTQETLLTLLNGKVIGEMIAAVDENTAVLASDIIKTVCESKNIGMFGDVFAVIIANSGSVSDKDAAAEGTYVEEWIKNITIVLVAGEVTGNYMFVPESTFTSLLDLAVSSEVIAPSLRELGKMNNPFGFVKPSNSDIDRMSSVFGAYRDATPTGFKAKVEETTEDYFRLFGVPAK